MIRKVCEQCGSENLIFTANAIWNVKTQKFEFFLCDGIWCSECDDTVNVVDKEIKYRKSK